ncbi:unnamed protein product [Rotaria sp. Silwood2]|nr:unnamed protein product [Rotaria sp. Silwood2]CAF2554272.1 unnamed protein product [Rotaria sp. Silwood2]CAF3880566.1 unnamed protein product [Rotaria sp. Silwood2]CAF4101779.1 unnamed protein product [Rotaria sp. Silwood2]
MSNKVPAPDSLKSSISSSSAPPPSTNNEMEFPSMENQKSLSSMSPPQAPQPGSLIVDENELNIENEQIKEVITKKKLYSDQVPKYDDTQLAHDKPWLLSMALHDPSTTFLIKFCM